MGGLLLTRLRARTNHFEGHENLRNTAFEGVKWRHFARRYSTINNLPPALIHQRHVNPMTHGRTVPLLAVCMPLLTAALAHGQTPVVDCVVVNPATSNLVAYFGYVSNLNGTVTFPAGSNNTVTGLQIYGTVPTTFVSQAAHILFSVQFVAAATASWTLNGQTATANSGSVSSPACQVAVGVTLPPQSGARSWNTLAAQGGALTCTAAEDVDGDGFCTILDCIGPAGAAGAAGASGPQGSQGPSGSPATAPALKTYSSSPGAANATASCGANEFLVTGGGTCTVPNLPNMGRIASSSPTANGSGWAVSCNAGQANAVAVCAAAQR